MHKPGTVSSSPHGLDMSYIFRDAFHTLSFSATFAAININIFITLQRFYSMPNSPSLEIQTGDWPPQILKNLRPFRLYCLDITQY